MVGPAAPPALRFLSAPPSIPSCCSNPPFPISDLGGNGSEPDGFPPECEIKDRRFEPCGLVGGVQGEG